MAEEFQYQWTDNPTVSGVAKCNTDVLNDCLMHLKYDKKDGGTGLQMFDTILKDHLLTYEESKGLALQGTYVYKNAIAGSRYGYPDFYAKCLEEYNKATEEIAIGYEPWTQPIATGATTAIDGGDMVITASNAYSGYDAYKAMDGTSSGTTATTGWGTNNTSAVQWWQVKFPYKIKITGLTGYQRYDTTPANANTVGRFYTSSDKTVPIGNEYNNAIATHWNAVSVTGIPSEGIVTDTIYFEKTGGGAYGGLGELVIKAEKLIIANPFTVYKNSNGHMFYNISQKAGVDDFFNKYGSAWFYGVDQENERVFLPRNNYFAQATGDSSEVGQSVEAGLPDHTHAHTSSAGRNGSGSGYDYWYGSATVQTGEASVSNPIYGNSNTVQPNAVKKLLYICVGNTVADTSWVDVVTQVNGGVKDLEDKTLEGIERLKATSNALNTTQITNCLLEVPQNIKLELADGTLTLKAGSKVIVPNGAGVFEEVVTASDLTTTIQNNGTYLIYKLSGNAINYQAPGTLSSGSTDSLSDQNWHIWYDTTNNLIKRYGASAQLIDSKCSFPIAIVTVSNGAISSIDQVFNGFGYIGSTLWVDKGVKGLIPNGRNADGTLNNIEFTRTTIGLRTLAGTSNVTFLMNPNGSFDYVPTNTVEYTNTPSATCRRYYGDDNYWRDKESGKTLAYVNVGTATLTNGVISNFQPKLPFRAIDYNDFTNIPHIVDTYVNGTSWYRIWSPDSTGKRWCKQGGQITSNGNSNTTVTLLKNYTDGNYNINLTVRQDGQTDDKYLYYLNLAPSVNSFQIRNSGGSTGLVYWSTEGYLA